MIIELVAGFEVCRVLSQIIVHTHDALHVFLVLTCMYTTHVNKPAH